MGDTQPGVEDSNVKTNDAFRGRSGLRVVHNTDNIVPNSEPKMRWI